MKGAKESLLASVSTYYSRKLHQHGATSKGVDWKDEASQHLRFRELIRMIWLEDSTSLLDYGCGFGALYPVLRGSGYSGEYAGFDIAREMIDKARALHGESDAAWLSAMGETEKFDYVVASGVFNVKLDHPVEEWRAYMCETLDEFNRIARNGFAFNVLTSYSDKEFQRADLYYADPCEWFDYCKRKFSPHVVLNHGYPLYEFTLTVLKG